MVLSTKSYMAWYSNILIVPNKFWSFFPALSLSLSISFYLFISLSTYLYLFDPMSVFFSLYLCYVSMHVQVPALRFMFHFLFYSLFLYLRFLSRYLAVLSLCISFSLFFCFAISIDVSSFLCLSFSTFLLLLFFLCFCLSISPLFWTLYYSTWSIKWRTLKASSIWEGDEYKYAWLKNVFCLILNLN